MSVIIYHNPRCSKSRQTLALLQERGIEPEVIEYLKTPPTSGQLQKIVSALEAEPQAIMRSNEDDYKAARTKVEGMTAKAQLTWLAEHPRVLQRPIVVTDRGARIGRPPETVLEIL